MAIFAEPQDDWVQAGAGTVGTEGSVDWRIAGSTGTQSQKGRKPFVNGGNFVLRKIAEHAPYSPFVD